jgi:iron complex transport system ATP-binding protein
LFGSYLKKIKQKPYIGVVKKMLVVKNITFRYRGEAVLSDVSFDVKRGEVVTILGPNGSGKSTLLRCLNRLLLPQSGVVSLDDQLLSRLSAGLIARMIAYVPQRIETAPVTVFDAVLLGRKPYFTWNASRSDYESVELMLRRFRLDSISDRLLNQLSGGEIQKTVLARGLVQEPKLLLFDEPTSALDLRNQVELLTLLRQFVRERNIIAIVCMHDINAAIRYTDRFLLLKKGRIIHDVNRDKLTAPMIESLYGLPVEIHDVANRSFVVESVL